MIGKVLIENYVSVVLYIGVAIIVWTSRKIMDRKIQVAAIHLLSLTLVLTIADKIDLYLAKQTYYLWLRTFCAWAGYAGRPLIVYHFMRMVSDDKKMNGLLLVPLGVNALLYLTGFWFNLCFYITPQNEWTRGPLWGANIVVSVAYVILTVILILKKDGKNRKITTLLSFCLITGLSSVIIEMMNDQPGVMYPTFIAIVLFIYVYFYLDEMNRRLTVQEMELREQQISLSLSQLQPHFISNGMVTIRRLIKIDPDRAIEAMDYFVDYLRKTIDSLQETELVPIENELQFVRDYLYIEKLRFGEDLKYDIVTDGSEFLVPPFSLQPVVENAIRHGIRKREDGQGRVLVQVETTPQAHIVRIMDNGVGFDPLNIVPAQDGHEHIGMKNTKYRVETMSNGHYIVESEIGKGTTVTICVPHSEKDKKKAAIGVFLS